MRKACFGLAAMVLISGVSWGGLVSVSQPSGTFSYSGSVVGPATGALNNLSDSGFSIRVDATALGGSDTTFTGLRKVLSGTVGEAVAAGASTSAPISNAAIRVEDSQGRELFTIRFAGTMTVRETAANIVWENDIAFGAAVTIQRGELLADVLPAGELSFVSGGIDSRTSFPALSDGTLRFGRSSGALDVALGLSFACRADLNGDQMVDDTDFIRFVAAYDQLTYADSFKREDFDDNRLVDDPDFQVFAAAYDTLVCD